MPGITSRWSITTTPGNATPDDAGRSSLRRMGMGTKSQKVIAREAAMILAIVIAGLRWTAYAQSEPVFEVSRAPASARSDANRSFDTSLRISRTPQRIAFQAAGLADVIAFAWGLPSDRIEKQPQWMYDDLYNVAVTTASPATLPEQQVMLQKLLEDRVGLVAHPISNPSSVYLLVPGPNVNLTPAREGDAPDSSGFQEGAQPLQSASGSFLPGRRWMGRHVSMSDLAAWL